MSSTPTDNKPPLPEALKVIADRAVSAGIKVAVFRMRDSAAPAWLELQIPSIEGTRDIRIEPDSAAEFASCEFENWFSLAPYDAFYDYKYDYILARVGGGNAGNIWKLAGVEETENYAGSPCRRIQITPPSGQPELELIQGFLYPECKLMFKSPLRDITLKISNIGRPTEKDAAEILDRLASSLFFEIDVAYGMHFRLRRITERHYRSDLDFDSQTRKSTPLFPRLTYDSNAITLYHYARNISDSFLQRMPLVEYLAFYQVIEYYMPAYSHADSLRRLRNALKDPRLDPDNDVSVGRLMSLIRDASQRLTEREQLKLTISACVEEDELLQYLRSDKDALKFFGDKTRILDVKTLNPENKQMTMVSQVAERIYDLRCRIVHSKEGRSSNSLLPYGREATRLGRDIALVRFIARKVLIASGQTWRH